MLVHSSHAVARLLTACLLSVPPRFTLVRLAEKAVLGAPLPVFGDLPLQPSTSAALREAGITKPTPIQQATMMPLYRGEDVVIHSATGSGKTLAYLLPLLQRLHVSRPGQLLVVVPSRELALQTAAAIEWVWPHHGTQRAFLLTATASAAPDLAEAMRIAACPVIVATPRPLLQLVRHLAGTDKLHSRRALRTDGEALEALSTRLKAIVLDEADALLLSRQIAISGPPKLMSGGRAAWRDGPRAKSGNRDTDLEDTDLARRGRPAPAEAESATEFERPEAFTLPVPRVVQALLNARENAAGGAAGGRGGGRGSSGRGRGGGRGGGRCKWLQLVACSATVSYRLVGELSRLLSLDEPDGMPVLTESSVTPSKRKTGERGRGAVGVPRTIAHSWVPVPSRYAKPEAAATVIAALAPAAALYFVRDDESVSEALEAMVAKGLDARALHDSLGLHGDDAAGAAPHSASSYLKLQRDLREVLRERQGAVEALSRGAGGDAASGGEAAADIAAVDSARISGGLSADGDSDPTSPAAAPAGAPEAAPSVRRPPLVLISSFGSARGLDLGGEVDCVVLSALPDAADTYLHLAGRTGRQGRQGRVVTLLAPEERNHLGKVTRQLGVSIRGDADLALAVAEAADGGAAVGVGAQMAEMAEWDAKAPVGGNSAADDAEWAVIRW